MKPIKPKRIQLSRKKGWKMPPNTIKADRSTKWGNPFIVGKHGTRQECVRYFRMLLGGYLCLGLDDECLKEQQQLLKHAEKHIEQLRGKNLACWCKGSPCHADVLLKLANPPISPPDHVNL